MVLSSIRIQRFRGLEDLKIDKMGRITVFTGKNGVGKSACLEAICLLKSGKDEFNDVLGKDLIAPILFHKTRDRMAWDYLIHKNSEEAHILGYETDNNDDGREIKVVISHEIDLQIVEDSVLAKFIKKHNEFEDHMSRIQERHAFDDMKIANKLVVHYEGESESLAELFSFNTRPRKIAASNYNAKKYPAKTLFLSSTNMIEVALHDRIAQTNRLSDLLTSLSSTIPNFKDLRKVEDHIRIFFSDGSNMPFFTMGDGTKATIIATLATHIADHGTIIMEEPENFLHPGLLNRLVDELAIAANSHSMQFFISTHSIELLERLLERKEDLDISVVQLGRLESETEAHVMDKHAAWKRIDNLGIDLRSV